METAILVFSKRPVMERLAAKLDGLPIFSVSDHQIDFDDPAGGSVIIAVTEEITWDFEGAYPVASAVVPDPVLVTIDFHGVGLVKQVVERLIVGEDAPVMIHVRDRFVEPAYAPAEFDQFPTRTRDTGTVLLYDSVPPSLERIAGTLTDLPVAKIEPAFVWVRWDQRMSLGLDLVTDRERALLTEATRREAAALVARPVYLLIEFDFQARDHARDVLARIVRGEQPPRFVKVRHQFAEPEASLDEFAHILDVFLVRGQPHD